MVVGFRYGIFFFFLGWKKPCILRAFESQGCFSRGLIFGVLVLDENISIYHAHSEILCLKFDLYILNKQSCDQVENCFLLTFKGQAELNMKID